MERDVEHDVEWAWPDRHEVRSVEDFEDELFPSSVEPVPEAPGARLTAEAVTIQARNVEVTSVTPASGGGGDRAALPEDAAGLGLATHDQDPGAAIAEEARRAIAASAWALVPGLAALTMLGLAAAAALNRAWGGEAGFVAVGAAFLVLSLLGSARAPRTSPRGAARPRGDPPGPVALAPRRS